MRLLVQIMAVLHTAGHVASCRCLAGFLPPWLDKAVTCLLWIWFTNLFNFMDGIDGISATEMICIGVGLCLDWCHRRRISQRRFRTYSLILAAAGCGFLWWNWHPAKIFLGDVGSIPIGFLLGYLLLLAAQSRLCVAAALILPAYYFIATARLRLLVYRELIASAKKYG